VAAKVSPRLPISKRAHTLIETTGEVLPDGTLLELVASRPDLISLLVWDGRGSTVVNRARFGSKEYKPLQVDPIFLQAIPLPSGATAYGSTKNLLDSISSLFQCYASVPKTSSALLSSFVLATWFADTLPSAPSIVLLGPEAHEAAQILRLMSLVTRRGLLLSAITPAGLCSLPWALNLTLLVDARKISNKTWQLFCASASPDAYVAIERGLSKLYFARALYVGDSSYDRDLVGAVEITMTPSQNKLPHLDSKAKRKILDEFQNKLLYYRLKNFASVSGTKVETAQFTNQLQDQAACFGASIVDAPELREDVLALLRPQDQDLRSERSCGLHAATIEALLALCHENRDVQVHVQEIADFANHILRDREGRSDLEPRKVGSVLRELGLFPTRLDRSGRGIILLPKTRAIIHRLGREYDVASIAKPFPGCKECTENGEAQPYTN